MSFGFGVGDIVALLELANRVRKDFVGAPEQFRSISVEYVQLASYQLARLVVVTNLCTWEQVEKPFDHLTRP
jgi:hypothetical protein